MGYGVFYFLGRSTGVYLGTRMGFWTWLACINTIHYSMYYIPTSLGANCVVVIQEYLPTSLEEKQVSILTSIILSNLFHLLALIPLYFLTRRLFPLNPSLTTVACVLHSFSPAGAFLLSGNTESLFIFLSFTGMALFHKEYRLVPALIWSLAGTVRSNALVWSGFFAWDALNEIIDSSRRDVFRTVGRVIYLGLCGLASLGGFAWWQYSAWEQYCSSSTPEPWCLNRIPLIYSHVQAKYWYDCNIIKLIVRDVGFLRYWTTSQLPNFLIASPHILLSVFAVSNHLRNKPTIYTFLSNPLTPHVLALAGMSFLLFTSMHVQIATRVLTAFPALYWYVAGKVVEDVQGVWVERTRFWEGGVRAIVVFGCVGAVLYSAFLPPA
jgi:GPI mannosyltransferase 2